MSDRWPPGIGVILILLMGTVMAQTIDPDYRLDSGDVVEISVFGVKDFRFALKVGSAGTVSVPFVGPVEARGLTVMELAERVEKVLDGRLFVRPKVSVVIKEYRPEIVLVVGAVQQPGTVALEPDEITTLLDVLSKAGGLSEYAGDTIVVRRIVPDKVEPEVHRVEKSALFIEGDVTQNLMVLAGDVVSVPPSEEDFARSYYIIGDVGRPGYYPLDDDQIIYLSQAVAAAGGPTRTAKMDGGVLVRFDGDGQKQEIAFNFKKLLVGEQEDMLVQPTDIIFVPGSRAKTIGYGLLGIIPTVAQTLAIRALIP